MSERRTIADTSDVDGQRRINIDDQYWLDLKELKVKLFPDKDCLHVIDYERWEALVKTHERAVKEIIELKGEL